MEVRKCERYYLKVGVGRREIIEKEIVRVKER